MAQLDDAHELRARSRPDFEVGENAFTLVDLFAGCGGLTLGAAQAAEELGLAIDVRLAVDIDQSAMDVYADNFGKAVSKTSAVDDYFDGELGASRTKLEMETKRSIGKVDLLVGGPPCQGHSSLNNHTRRDDPKNSLYSRMARAAEVLQPSFVLIENVPAVRHDIADVVGVTSAHLRANAYTVAETTVSLHALGVAQRRKRHIILASRLKDFDPAGVLRSITDREADPVRTVRWAISDLEELENRSGYDVPPRAGEVNMARMKFLIDHDVYDLPNSERPKCHQNSHSYKSMYGRLNWDLPAQTITSGFGSIGQGRYMHPSTMRALTPHEAARLQGFPDYFDFSSVTKRTALATMIGNAVPPPLARTVVSLLIPHLAGLKAKLSGPP